MAGRVTVGLTQFAMGDSLADNLAQAEAQAAAAAAAGAQLVVLPELFAGRYFCQAEDPRFFDWAEPADGATVRRFAALAGKLGVAMVIPFFERRAAGVYHNSAVVADADGSVVGHYRKMHIPDDPNYYEKFYFAPGDLGFRAAPTRFGKVGVLICWDQWFPEAARLTALAGADILVYPTAIGWLAVDKPTLGERQVEAWRMAMRGHAVANGLFVAACNRVGAEPGPDGGIEFWGHSFVAGPQGEFVARSGPEPDVLLADVDYRQTEEVRRLWPFLRDRRIDAYGNLSRRWVDGGQA